MLIKHFQMFAQYNTLANHKLYEVCAQISDAERKRTRLAFFKSIHGTLNHLIVGDRIWLTRFEGQIPSTRLDALLYDDFDELREARVVEDQRIETFAAGLTEEFLGRMIQYVNNAGKICNDPVDLLVAHFFNHQTHHRGQIHRKGALLREALLQGNRVESSPVKWMQRPCLKVWKKENNLFRGAGQ